MKDRTVKILAAILAVMLSAASCAVHEWPEELPANATLKLDFNTALPQFLVMDLNQGTRVSKDGKDYEIRYVIEAYRKLSTVVMTRFRTSASLSPRRMSPT